MISTAGDGFSSCAASLHGASFLRLPDLAMVNHTCTAGNQVERVKNVKTGGKCFVAFIVWGSAARPGSYLPFRRARREG